MVSFADDELSCSAVEISILDPYLAKSLTKADTT